jgi:hypothetical protein
MKATQGIYSDAQIDRWEEEEQQEFVFINNITGARWLCTAADDDHAIMKLLDHTDGNGLHSWFLEV